MANIARAIDLYLALENAYKYYVDNQMENYDYYYGGTDAQTPLLTEVQRREMLENFGMNLRAFFKFNRLQLGDFNDVVDHNGYIIGEAVQELIDQISSAADLSLDELQPGNWPFKNFLAAGYGSLAMNVSDSNSLNYKDIFNHAYRTAFEFQSQERKKYWSYQTSNGKRYWAEGPFYFNFTLRELIPFWHAVRSAKFYSNGQITYSGLSVADPFFNSSFTNPLEWLADIVTPEGKTPPLDDGNKVSIENSSILRWSSSYGKESVGNKFAAINESENIGSFGSAEDLLLVELAIPRVASAGEMPDSNFPNYSTSNVSDQQIILRHKSTNNNMHYVLLNGERGDAIARGEGHEQPDQLQLLYYMDDTSYLMDSGYDNGGLNNSSWNDWDFHSVMSSNWWHDWMFPPQRGWRSVQNLKPRMVSDLRHYDIEEFSIADVAAKVSEARGKVTTEIFTINGQSLGFHPYWRDVLFVKDPNNPYIIDMNKVQGPGYNMDDFGVFMRYWGRGGTVDQVGKWYRWSVNGQQGKKLHMFIEPVEFSAPAYIELGSAVVEERNSVSENARTLKIYNKNWGSKVAQTFSTVAFIHVTESPYSEPDPQFNSTIGPMPEQVLTYKVDSFTIDVLWRRSFAETQNIERNVYHNGTFVAKLSLSANSNYGFMRLRKQGELWVEDPDFSVNLQQKGHLFIGNTTFTSNTTFTEDVYLSGDEQDMFIKADVTFAPGSTVHVYGEDMSITTSGSGRIIANNVTFREESGSFQGVKLFTPNNQIDGSTFENGYYGMKVYADGNTIYRSTFKDNNYGLYTAPGVTVSLRGVVFEDNLTGILTYGDVYVDDYYNSSSSFDASSFSGHNDGVLVTGSGRYYNSRTRYSNNTYAVKTYGNARYHPHHYEFGNAFYNAGTNYIYESSNNNIIAYGQHWGLGTAPSPSMFYGTIDYRGHQSDDPTYPGFTADCPNDGAPLPQGCDSGGGSGPSPGPGDGSNGDPVPEVNDGSTISMNLTADSTGQISQPDRWNLDAGKVNQKLKQMYNLAASDISSPKAASYLLQAFNLIDLYRFEGRNTAMGRLENELLFFVKIYDQHGAAGAVNAETGKLALHLYLDILLRQSKYQKLLAQSSLYAPLLNSPGLKAAYLTVRMSAYIGLGDYKQALHVLDQLEQHQASRNLSEPENFGPLRKDLTRRAAKAGILTTSVVGKAMPEQVKKNPEKFSLQPAYPNPFNPSTVISYVMKTAGHARIEVYDITGRRVARLINRQVSAGGHQITFDASGLSSGVYMVRGDLAGSVFTRKITLIK